ncbi:SDR family NAD(P)-dependent oxidoreductase [Thermoleophilia bacterium SCSIO 60948]|nr:SDR family NAD(P)-dependent oxidoreductase [Thermoleophilia bacterium SCSIO 60948]
MSAPVLVTGGAGFIGSAIVDALVAGGHEVRVLDSLHPDAHAGRPDYLNEDATYLWGDVGDPDAVAEAVDGVTAVCHQAAMVGLGLEIADITKYVRDNSMGTATLLRALADRRYGGRIVLASSMVVYGEGGYECPEHGRVAPGPRQREDLDGGQFEPPCPVCGRRLEAVAVGEDSAPDPRNVYAATKLEQEYLCATYARELSTTSTALRYHNVYGPRMPRDTPYAGVASIFRSALAAGRAPRVFEDGEQIRDFVNVADVARANVLALTADEPYDGPLNVASGTPRTVGDMARALASAMDGPEPEVTGEYRLGDVRHVFASPDRARAELGFSAAISLEDGVEEFATAPLREPASG